MVTVAAAAIAGAAWLAIKWISRVVVVVVVVVGEYLIIELRIHVAITHQWMLYNTDTTCSKFKTALPRLDLMTDIQCQTSNWSQNIT